jgi:hypothetical protein
VKTLGNAADRQKILRRLRGLHSDKPPVWGRMTAPQVVCHLADAFRNVLGERPAVAGPPPSLLNRTVVKWLFLYVLPQPRGIKTRPESDQALGGTPPTDFTSDVANLENVCERFASAHGQAVRRPHFIFGSMTNREWHRWGWLHMDHHLRQFGL